MATRRFSAATKKLQRKQREQLLRSSRNKAGLQRAKAYKKAKIFSPEKLLSKRQEERIRVAIRRAIKESGYKNSDFSSVALQDLQGFARQVFKSELKRRGDPGANPRSDYRRYHVQFLRTRMLGMGLREQEREKLDRLLKQVLNETINLFKKKDNRLRR